MSQTWTVLALIRWTARYLAEHGFNDARLEAELLLAGALGLKRLELYLQFDRPLAPEELAVFKARLLRRAKREPLQYIDGYADFRDLRLAVDRRVLIPRPETESLVGEVLAWARERPAASAVDVGTGSGAIALSLVTEGDFTRIVATDVSADALAVARENRDRIAPGAPIELRLGPVYEPLAGERFDVIVCNPPYIAAGERETLAPEVARWEPATALFAGETGLEVVDALIQGAPDHLRPGGLLALELGATQARAAVERARARGAFGSTRIAPDLAGRDRILLAHLR